jgi:hypothetical protein
VFALFGVAATTSVGVQKKTKRKDRQPIIVYRVYDDDEAVRLGRSYSFEDPTPDPKGYAYRYGVPPYDATAERGRRGNKGTFWVKAIFRPDVAIIAGTPFSVQPARGIPGYPGSGGWPELYFPEGPKGSVIPIGGGPLVPPASLRFHRP